LVGVNRQYPRYALKAEVEVIGPRPLVGRARNLSRGGVCAEFAEEVVTGTEIQLRLCLVFDTNSFSEPLVVSARVVWCTGVGERYQIGAQWLQLDSEQISYLEMFLRFLAEGERRTRHNRETEESGPFG
jgi:hypothetical protein